MNIPKVVSIIDKFLNPTDAQTLKNVIYQLQQENIDFKVKYQECLAKLQKLEHWEHTKSGYKEHKTKYGGIVYTKAEESAPNIYYCPVCFSKKLVIPLQKLSPDLAEKYNINDFPDHQLCPSCNAVFYIIGG